jgi:hypothetical protein
VAIATVCLYVDPPLFPWLAISYFIFVSSFNSQVTALNSKVVHHCWIYLSNFFEFDTHYIYARNSFLKENKKNWRDINLTRRKKVTRKIKNNNFIHIFSNILLLIYYYIAPRTQQYAYQEIYYLVGPLFIF